MRWDLTVSNPAQAGLPYPAPLAEVFGRVDWTAYTPHPAGLSGARAAVAEYLSRPERTFGADQLVLTASTSEAYALVFKTFCDPGDAVAVAVPSYPLITHLLELEGLEPVRFELTYRDRWTVDLEGLERALLAQARAVVLVAPNNPTGNVPTDAELAGVCALCARFDVPLVIDAVFAPYGAQPSVVTRVSEHIVSITLDGLSKAVGLPQLKLGWTLVQGPSPRRAEVLGRLEFVNDAYLSAASPVQHAAPELLRHAPTVQAAIGQRLQTNRAVLADALAGHPRARVLADDGGWYAVVGLHDADEETTCLDLLEAGVAVQPGFLYDFPRGSHLVVSVLTEPRCFAEGVAVLAQRL